MNEGSLEKNGLELRYASAAPKIWEELDRIPRTGWVRRGVSNPETVRDHTISLRRLAAALAGQLPEFSEKDIADIINMLELHDYPEVITGDEVIVTKDAEEKKRLKAEKFQRELAAMRRICQDMGPLGEEAFALWMRFEERKDPASSFARQLDLYQAMEKALEYEQTREPVSTLDFIEYAEKDIVHPILVERIQGLRDALGKSA